MCSLSSKCLCLIQLIVLALGRFSRPSFSFAGKGLWDFPSPTGLLWGGCSRNILSLQHRGMSGVAVFSLLEQEALFRYDKKFCGLYIGWV